jgi:hypothetical protein
MSGHYQHHSEVFHRLGKSCEQKTPPIHKGAAGAGVQGRLVNACEVRPVGDLHNLVEG